MGLVGFVLYGCGTGGISSDFMNATDDQIINAYISTIAEVYGYQKEAVLYNLMSQNGSHIVETLGNWARIYDSPTITSIGRVVYYPDDISGKYFKPDQITSWYSQEYYPNPYSEESISDLRLEGKTYLGNGNRYVIALGPEVLIPGYPLDGTVAAEGFTYGTDVDAIIEDNNGNVYYIPCTLGDVKVHTYPNGIYQTGEAYPNALGNPEDAPDHANGSMVEFVTAEKLSVFRDYSLKGVIVYD